MKAIELKKLIAKIPDNEEIYYGHYDTYCEEWDHKDDFKPEELYFKNGIKFWLINGGQPQDSLEKSEYDKTIEWQSIIKSFPSKNGWTIDDRTFYSSRSIVAFQAGGFEFKIAFWRGKNKLIKTSLCHDQEFDSWDEFFAVAVPAAKRAAQKQREELESLLDS